MERKTATLLGAAAALAAGQALAAPSPTQPAQPKLTYADLLEPIPNAAEQLKAADMEASAQRPPLVEVQYFAHHHHHHHHHHHNRGWYLQNGYSWYGGRWVLRPRHHHHHHHHHHHNHY